VTEVKSIELISLLEDLTGQRVPLAQTDPNSSFGWLQEWGPRLGYSQFNEVLLLLGYDRVTASFFQYLVDGSTDYTPGAEIKSLSQLREGVERFQKLALLLFGNVKFAFKKLSREPQDLVYCLSLQEPRDESSFEARHDAVRPIEKIPGTESFYLGYLVERELKERLLADPSNEAARGEEQRRQAVVATGMRNHEAYLASDHLDVYVATSMRERHEYLLVSDLTTQIFSQEKLVRLKLRWFDPTQAYCADRVDKGLAEALMLKRAKCTLYFAQETDTLGKDSELASTLAQGKPVIAFVPRPGDDYVDALLSRLRGAYPGKDDLGLLVDQLRVFQPDAAWRDARVRRCLDIPSECDVEELKTLLATSIRNHYDRRARMLREDHPLGIQVNLATGVANGVLVARTIEDCAELIYRVVTTRLQFTLESETRGDRKYFFLKEVSSGCIFRVMTGDAMLTNSFWNFYLDPSA
jgi:hypothetical protein